MQKYRYRAVAQDGDEARGIINAKNETEAMLRLRETYPIVTKLAAVQSRLAPRPQTHKISEKALAVMCSQFAIILSSGIPMVRAVELIANQTQDKALSRVLKESVADVSAGTGLAQAMSSHGASIPATFLETVRSGEESGTLDVSFRRLETYYDKSSKIRSKVRAAMVYPTFTMVVAAIVVIIIMVVAVPAFTQSFSSMGVELPLITRMLIGMSGFFTRFWLVLFGLIAGGYVGYKAFLQSPNGKLFDARLRLKIPALGNIVLMKTAAQFANTLSTLLAAGLPMLRAATVAAGTLDNAYISDALRRELPGIEAGRTLGHCLALAKVFPEMLREMVNVGEETGTLEETLRVVGAYYDNETEQASQKALTLLEPVIIIFLAVVVAFVLLSVYLPMFSLYANMG